MTGDELLERLKAGVERVEAFSEWTETMRGRAVMGLVCAPLHLWLARRAWRRGRTKRAFYWTFALGSDWEQVYAVLRERKAAT